MNSKRWIALGVFIFLFVIFLIVGKEDEVQQDVSLSFNDYLFSGQKWTSDVYREGSGEDLALLRLEGVIMDGLAGDFSSQNGYNHQVFMQQLQSAYERDDIKGIVLFVDSPGGGVYESDEVYRKIAELKKRYNKPLVISMGKIAASGAYYISSPADAIYADRNTLTGSIGVIMSTYNYEELAENLGIKQYVFKSGKNKDILNPMREASEEEKEIMQAIIDESYGYFVDVVADGRKLDRDKVIEIADGRIYTAKQARELGLIDEIGGIDEAIEKAAELAGINDPAVLEFKTIYPSKFEQLLNFRSPSLDILGVKEELESSHYPSLMYISNW